VVESVAVSAGAGGAVVMKRCRFMATWWSNALPFQLALAALWS